jgi:hypothetical protein
VKRLILAGAMALAPTLALAADISGAWIVNGDFDAMGIKYSLTCSFTDDNGKLSGPCKSDQGDVTATGAVDGANVEFGYDTTYQGAPVHLDYKGAVQPDGSIKGSIATGGPEGAFTATKQ